MSNPSIRKSSGGRPRGRPKSGSSGGRGRSRGCPSKNSSLCLSSSVPKPNLSNTRDNTTDSEDISSSSDVESIGLSEQESSEDEVLKKKKTNKRKPKTVVASNTKTTTYTSSSSSPNSLSKRINPMRSHRFGKLYLTLYPRASWMSSYVDAIPLNLCDPPSVSPLLLGYLSSFPPLKPSSPVQNCTINIQFHDESISLKGLDAMVVPNASRPIFFIYSVYPVHSLSFYQNLLAVSSYSDFTNTPHLASSSSSSSSTDSSSLCSGLFSVWHITTTSPKLLYYEDQGYQHVIWFNAYQLGVCTFDGYFRLRSFQQDSSSISSSPFYTSLEWKPMARPLVACCSTTFIALGLANGVISLYTFQGQLVFNFHAHDNFIKALSFHSSGLYLCSTGGDGRVCVHDIRELGKFTHQVTRIFAILQACTFHPSLDLFLFADNDHIIKGCHPIDTKFFSYHRHPASILDLSCTSRHSFMVSVGLDGGVYMCNTSRVRSRDLRPQSTKLLQLSIVKGEQQNNEEEKEEKEMIEVDETLVNEVVNQSAETKMVQASIKDIPLSLALFTVDWNHQSKEEGHWVAVGGYSGLVIITAAPTT